MDYTTEIKGHVLEFIDDEHTYLVDGIILPSITGIVRQANPDKYKGIDKETLKRAADKGTAVHEAIEMYIREGKESDLPELRNFKFLMKHYGFKPYDVEVPVILFKGDEPYAAGRLDLVLEMDGKIGGADIKRTSALDKDYLAYQLNLYRIAYRQSYDIEWEFLRGIWLRDDTRKFVEIPIVEELAEGLLV